MELIIRYIDSREFASVVIFLQKTFPDLAMKLGSEEDEEEDDFYIYWQDVKAIRQKLRRTQALLRKFQNREKFYKQEWGLNGLVAATLRRTGLLPHQILELPDEDLKNIRNLGAKGRAQLKQATAGKPLQELLAKERDYFEV